MSPPGGTRALRRGTTVSGGRIEIAWVLTLPASGLVAALSYVLLRPILG